MSTVYYCPECRNELEEISGCGSVSYFCHTCKKLISRKQIITKEEAQTAGAEQSGPDKTGKEQSS
ncbi:MAG: zinc-ribbon domain-containing protein [Clostridia bacterium]|jgi:DNA-directed RNA polymerase subunit RPC12/RpoP|nr:zinc-ribbon domain-containing protein [Clostridia bacterium]